MMEFNKSEQSFHALGKKYTGKFEEYPIVIPKATDDFKEAYQKERKESTFTRVIVYEPKRGPEHTIGYFYLGALIEEEQLGEVPEDMYFLNINGEFATLDR